MAYNDGPTLSPFQREKLEYYFNFFDSDGNGQLEIDDLDGFMKKVLEFTKWEPGCAKANQCYEIHECFFDTLAEKARKGKTRITLRHWMTMWEEIIPGCTAMPNFPIWLQLLPKSLFRIIDSKQDGKIDQSELAEFYILFVGISPDNADSLSTYAMEQMTDHGRWPLNLQSYNQMFANFLIGKTPYGPGRFMFGCFEHMVDRGQFQLIQGPPENPDPCRRRMSMPGELGTSPPTPSIVKFKYLQAA